MSAAQRPIGVGVIGLGFMGRTHIEAYRKAHERGFANRLVAVHDPIAERLSGKVVASGNFGNAGAANQLFDPAVVRAHERIDQLLADPEVELVSICTPTPTHVELALAALAANKHVLLEKPVALASTEVARLAAAARAASTVCMPAMCMRFWPGWSWLAERVRDGSFGAVRSAVFRRLGSRPSWSTDFYSDPESSGGALFDLHVHDADFVRWCFGTPEAVASTGSLDHVTTLYRYPRGPAHVAAEGGWDHGAGFPFRMTFVAVFEHATAEFDLAREPRLALTREGVTTPVPLEPGAGYEGEIAHVLDAIATGRRQLAATLDEAVELTRMLEAERASLQRGEWIRL